MVSLTMHGINLRSTVPRKHLPRSLAFHLLPKESENSAIGRNHQCKGNFTLCESREGFKVTLVTSYQNCCRHIPGDVLTGNKRRLFQVHPIVVITANQQMNESRKGQVY